MIFKRFFVVDGRGVSRTSDLMAFDKALFESGISQCNLVPVSSILPAESAEIAPIPITPGEITFTVLSREDGIAGEDITAGIAWAYCSKGGRKSYGIVAEDHGKKTREECERDLRIKINEMAYARGMEAVEYHSRISDLQDIPPKSFGCVVSALIYSP